MENTQPAVDIERVKKLLKKTNLLKGQITHIATCDSDGNPNLAPVGSMRIAGNDTIHVIQAYLEKTYSNLKQNPKATFSFVKMPGVSGFLDFIGENSEQALGYRIHCDYVESSSSKELLKEETAHVLTRFPWFMRKSFSKFAQKHFKHVLKFKITNIRPSM